MKRLLSLFSVALFLFAIQNAAWAKMQTERGAWIVSRHEVPVSSNAFSGHIAFELSGKKSGDATQYFIYVSEHLQSSQPMTLLNFNYEVPVKVTIAKADGAETLFFTKENATIYSKEKAIKYNLDMETKSKLQNITEIKFFIPMFNNAIIPFTLRKDIADEWNQVLAATI
jgi:hypothetical protein